MNIRISQDIERRGLRDLVYDRILEILLTGEIKAEQRVSIDGLAKLLDVSPTPVREALVDLERTGLVVREALRGYRVAPPLSREQLQELFEARELVETHATDLARAAGDDFLTDLQTAHSRHEEAGQMLLRNTEGTDTGPTPTEQVSMAQDYFSRDKEFHEVILGHCHNRYLVDMSHNLGAQVHRLRQALPHGINDVSEAIAEHRAIIDAFSSGDSEAPQKAMREHIRGVAKRALAEELDTPPSTRSPGEEK